MSPRKIELCQIQGSRTLQEYISTEISPTRDVSGELLITSLSPTPLARWCKGYQRHKIAASCFLSSQKNAQVDFPRNLVLVTEMQSAYLRFLDAYISLYRRNGVTTMVSLPRFVSCSKAEFEEELCKVFLAPDQPVKKGWHHVYWEGIEKNENYKNIWYIPPLSFLLWSYLL